MLAVKDLHVAYGQSQALHGLSFEAHKNETVAIMGRNGMGKTTLFKSLIGILPLKSGQIEVAGKEVGLGIGISVCITMMPTIRTPIKLKPKAQFHRRLSVGFDVGFGRIVHVMVKVIQNK